MKFQWCFLIIIITLVVGCKTENGNDRSTPTIVFHVKDEDFAIYTLLLTTEFPAETNYFIEQQTGCLVHPLEPENFPDILTDLHTDTIIDYAKKNEQELILAETFSQSEKFKVINEQNYWDEIFWGVFHLSSIGYSEDRTQALVCTGLNNGRGHVRDIRITLLSHEADGCGIQGSFTIHQR
jgi:hypothetical protein